jgi:LysM repeat protein
MDAMPWRAPLAVVAALVATVTMAKAEDVTHVIRPGDTPVVLAKTYHVPVAAILARNTHLDPCRLKVGDIMVVPLDARVPDQARPSDAAGAGSAALPDEEVPGGCYVVSPGDCPASIATRFGVSVEDLSRANPGLDPKNLAVGRVLAIPTVAAAAPPPVPVARPGEPGQAAPLVMDFQ